jgi:hypothetical protein
VRGGSSFSTVPLDPAVLDAAPRRGDPDNRAHRGPDIPGRRELVGETREPNITRTLPYARHRSEDEDMPRRVCFGGGTEIRLRPGDRIVSLDMHRSATMNAALC